MFLAIFSTDEQIIYVTNNSWNVWENVCHFCLKGFRSRTYSERKMFETESSERSNESSKRLRLFIQRNLKKKHCCNLICWKQSYRKLCQKLISCREWKIFTKYIFIQLSEIYTKSDFSIWLWHNNDGKTPFSWPCDWPNCILFFHLFQFSSTFFFFFFSGSGIQWDRLRQLKKVLQFCPDWFCIHSS